MTTAEVLPLAHYFSGASVIKTNSRRVALLAVALAIPLTLGGTGAMAVTPTPTPTPTTTAGPTETPALKPSQTTAPSVPAAPEVPTKNAEITPPPSAPAATAEPSMPATATEMGKASMGKAGLNAPAAESQARQLRMAVQSPQPSVPEQPSGTAGKPLGLDVSSWQGSVNWADVRNKGARFAYVKATEGTGYKNPYFAAQYGGATSAGLLRGAYHFAAPSVSNGATQAQFFINNGGGWTADGITMPPTLDIEDNPYGGTDKCYGMSPAQLTTWVRDFTSTVFRLTNKHAMIYTGYWFWRDCLGNTTEFSTTNPLWLASYYTSSPAVPGGWSTYTIWQYANDFANASQTVKATFPGDQNVFNGNIDQLRNLAATADAYPIGLISGATLLTGKWAGDGKAKVGWFKDGFWCLQMAAAPRRCFSYGNPGDRPVTGDWNGDGTAGIGIVRNGVWWLVDDINTMRITKVVGFGVGSDTPIVGDWNGSGKDSIGIWRGASFQVSYSVDNPVVNEFSDFGVASDTPLVGDWDGNGKTSIGVWRDGVWWLSSRIKSPLVTDVLPFGVATDRPITGDWDGNKSSTIGIVRGNSWQLTNSLAQRGVDISFN